MKKIYLSLILVAGILSSLVSCSDDLLGPVAAKGDNIVLSAPTGGTYALSASTASATAFTAKWTSSTFGYSAAVRYTLQVIKILLSAKLGSKADAIIDIWIEAVQAPVCI